MPTTIVLSEPITDASGKTVTSITLRKPNYVDYFEIGAPVVLVTFQGGGSFEQETPSIVNAWIERLADCGRSVLDQLNLCDTLALRDAIVSQFPLREPQFDAQLRAAQELMTKIHTIH